MTPSDTAAPPRTSTSGSAPTDGLRRPVAVARPTRRDRIRSKPGLGHAYRIVVFVAGLACIALGFALAVLPGPLTIPPVLLGLWIWSKEFPFAERFFDSFKRKAHDARAHAKQHPASSAAITIGGLVLAGVAFWAVGHFELVANGKDAVGI
jgi:uncharacterized membrane protein YbaN (DUF454 family)